MASYRITALRNIVNFGFKFFFQNATAISHGLPPVVMRTCHVANFRWHVLEELKRAGTTDSKGKYCNFPFCKGPSGQTINWVQCDGDHCGIWCHSECVGIGRKEAAPKVFLCPLCMTARSDQTTT